MRCAALLAVALGALGCADGDYKHRLSTVPAELGDGWATATPEDVGLDPQVLAGIHDELLRPDRHFGALGFLVVKDGRLVFETYLRREADRDSLHHVQSITKSVTSLLVGVGREQGWVPSLDTPLCDVLVPECEGLADARKRSITLRHLLTMRSGLDVDDVALTLELWVDQVKDPIRHVLARPLFAEPGSTYRYRSADTQLVGYALERLADQPESERVQAEIFDPLGIRDVFWAHGPSGETMAAHGLHLKARDLARLGVLALQRGQWDGRQVVPEAWLAESTRAQTDTDRPGYSYGYAWWVVDEANAFSAVGHGGQFIFVVPAKQLVLVQVALPDTTALHGSSLEDFVELTRPLWE